MWQEEKLLWRYFMPTFCVDSRASWDWSLGFCFWRVLQVIVQLILCCFGASLAEVHAPCSGMAHGDTVLELGHGEHMALAVQEGQSGTGYLGRSFFFMVQWQLLMNVHSLFGVEELWLPRRLRKWLFGLLSACHTYLELARPRHGVCAFRAGYCPELSTPSPVSALSPPGLRADWIAWVCLHLEEVMSKIHTCLRQVYLYNKNMHSPHQCVQIMQSVFARIFRTNGHNFCAWDFTILTCDKFVFLLNFGVRLIPGLDLEVLLLQGQKTPCMFQKNFSKAVGLVFVGNEGLGIKWDILEKIIHWSKLTHLQSAQTYEWW